jgi:hypothetical protein
MASFASNVLEVDTPTASLSFLFRSTARFAMTRFSSIKEDPEPSGSPSAFSFEFLGFFMVAVLSSFVMMGKAIRFSISAGQLNESSQNPFSLKNDCIQQASQPEQDRFIRQCQ